MQSKYNSVHFCLAVIGTRWNQKVIKNMLNAWPLKSEHSCAISKFNIMKVTKLPDHYWQKFKHLVYVVAMECTCTWRYYKLRISPLCQSYVPEILPSWSALYTALDLKPYLPHSDHTLASIPTSWPLPRPLTRMSKSSSAKLDSGCTLNNGDTDRDLFDVEEVANRCRCGMLKVVGRGAKHCEHQAEMWRSWDEFVMWCFEI